MNRRRRSKRAPQVRAVEGGSVARERDGEVFFPEDGPRVLYVLVGSDGADSCSFRREELTGVVKDLKSWGVPEAAEMQVVQYIPKNWADQRLRLALKQVEDAVAEHAASLGPTAPARETEVALDCVRRLRAAVQQVQP